ncbi:MAG: SMC family ATPase, partial [Pedococcus sp.]
MRLHHLSVTAFGPFAGSVEVDLDEVAAGGLFLIRGATGAGKTSLLDAIAFALYADVPGSRSKKGLHSDHADRGAVPQVTLEFTAVGRRFRLERSPEFQRPKSRGTGETKVQAKAVLWEQRSSGWEALSTRHDEIAEVVKDVLGMGLEQFNKVVLLPQGDFAAFLRATPEERRGLLEKLFDVSTYAGVEEWFATQRKESAAAVEAHQAALRSDLAVLADVLADAPLGLVADALGGEATDSEATDWSALGLEELPGALDAICAALEGASVEAMAVVDTTKAADSLAGNALLTARQASARRARGREASEVLERLTTQQAEHDAEVARLDAAARARSVSGDLAALTRSEDAVAQARERLEGTARAMAGLAVDPADLQSALDRVASATVGLDEADRHRRSWQERTRQHAVLVEQSRQVEVAGAKVESRIAACRDAALTARQELAQTTQAAGSVDAAAALVRDLAGLHRTRVALDRGTLDLAAATSLVDERRTRAQDLRDTYQDLRQARLDGIAAELAARLEEGRPCPVCGSAEHPAPATGGASISAEVVEEAEHAWQVAADLLSAARSQVASLEASQAERLAQLGAETRDADALAEAVSRARAEHTSLVDRAATLDRARVLVDTAETEIATLAEQAADLRDTLTAARTTVAGLEADLIRDVGAVRDTLTQHTTHCPCAGSAAGAAGAGAAGLAAAIAAGPGAAITSPPTGSSDSSLEAVD